MWNSNRNKANPADETQTAAALQPLTDAATRVRARMCEQGVPKSRAAHPCVHRHPTAAFL